MLKNKIALTEENYVKQMTIRVDGAFSDTKIKLTQDLIYHDLQGVRT